ncbi:hypothetical protein [Tortoise microvirus 79]|nr:hypothetical protein [Tortoise microvirus 79]
MICSEERGSKMIEIIKNNLIYPTLTRLGTLGAGLLVSLGMHEATADQVVVGAIALALFAVDLTASHFNRKRERSK